MRKFRTEKKMKGKSRQRSSKVYFRPNLERTYKTLDLALVEHPLTSEKDWLCADSTAEYKRFDFLLKRMAAGDIEELYFHPEFILLPSLKIPANKLWGKKPQAQTAYKADFSYYLCIEGQRIFVVEDFKAVYSDTPKNRAKGIALKPILQGDSRLRHKLLIAKLIGLHGANCRFKIVVQPEANLMEDSYVKAD